MNQTRMIRVHFVRDRANTGLICNWCAEPLPGDWDDAGDNVVAVRRSTWARLEGAFNEHQAQALYETCLAEGGRVVART